MKFFTKLKTTLLAATVATTVMLCNVNVFANDVTVIETPEVQQEEIAIYREFSGILHLRVK